MAAVRVSMAPEVAAGGSPAAAGGLVEARAFQRCGPCAAAAGQAVAGAGGSGGAP
jgi:hypothetical protein